MSKRWLTVLVGAFIIVLIGTSYYHQEIADTGISLFNEKRDMNDILSLMRDNWYWLISSPDYQAEFMLREKAPSHKEPKYFGKLIIKVLRKNNKLAGFTAYYKKTESQGHILFLAIDKNFRREGYASQLFHHAINDLKKLDAIWVHLVTREGNKRARSLYKKLGMKECRINNGFVHYRMLL